MICFLSVSSCFGTIKKNALITLTDKKATGIDDIPAEILKNLDEYTKSLLFKIINECYETGKLPKDFIKSKSITIPKKGTSTNCTNYRTITLLPHASKILLNIIKNRLKGKIEDQLGKDQFGFKREREELGKRSCL